MKIIKFEKEYNKVVDFLDAIKKEIVNNDIDNIYVSYKNKDGEIIGGRVNLSLTEVLAISSNIQMSVFLEITK